MTGEQPAYDEASSPGQDEASSPGKDEAGSPGQIDMRLVLAEIDQEVREKRATGELPEDFERQLDREFARFAPVDAVTGDFSTLLAKLEGSTTIDTRAPTASSRPGVAPIKAAVARAIDWDLRHMAGQVSGLAHALTRVVAMLGERVDDLERDAPSAVDTTLMDLAPGEARAALPDGDWEAVVTAALRGVEGRVLHTECGSGRLVAALRAAGFDVYGVEPDERLILEAPVDVPDVRHDRAADHLRRLPAGSLGAAVLSGCVDRLPAGGTVELVDLARSRVRAGGRLVVVSHHPRAWFARPPSIAVDLAGGRPLHAGTWRAVLEARGFSDIAVHDGPPPAGKLELTGGDTAETARIDAAIAAVNGWLNGPAGFAVTATR